MANLIHSEIGRGSIFARRHGFYADVVTPELATLPIGWERRLKRLRVGKVTALCLEGHDLVVSKLAAGRLKDLEFVGALLRTRVVNLKTIRRRVRQLPRPIERGRIRVRLRSVLDELRWVPVRKTD